MNVICKKGSTRLVKGHGYEVVGIWNLPNSTWKSVHLENFGRYSVKNFTTTDGKPLPFGAVKFGVIGANEKPATSTPVNPIDNAGSAHVVLKHAGLTVAVYV